MLKIFPEKLEASYYAVSLFLDTCRKAIEERGKCTIALTGGSSPDKLYSLLAEDKDKLDWSKLYIFWGDERMVPFNHPDNNAAMAYEKLLNHVPVNPEQVFRMHHEPDPETAAVAYQKQVTDVLGEENPRFDLILLGMGDDGHTASLFPGTRALAVNHRWVVANYVEAKDAWRITFTYPLINRARQVVFLVFGEKKAPVLHEVLNSEEKKYPVQHVEAEQVAWILDKAAAGKQH